MIINYVWFNEGEDIPNCILEDFNSLKEIYPNSELLIWTLKDVVDKFSNIEHEIVEKINMLVEGKKFAFASDLARVIILYHFGGLYKDVDFNIKKKINFNEKKINILWENYTAISTSLIYSNKKNYYIKLLLKYYKECDNPSLLWNNLIYLKIIKKKVTNKYNKSFENETIKIFAYKKNKNIFTHQNELNWIKKRRLFAKFSIYFQKLLLFTWIFKTINWFLLKKIILTF